LLKKNEWKDDETLPENVEKSYWEFVEGENTEEIKVEYSADINSQKFGSGFPTQADQEYTTHPWNFNNFHKYSQFPKSQNNFPNYQNLYKSHGNHPHFSKFSQFHCTQTLYSNSEPKTRVHRTWVKKKYQT
jgi:hypothetical protein